MAHLNLHTALTYLLNNFSNAVIKDVYSTSKEIDIIFNYDGKELLLFSNTDEYFVNNETFVIIENN